MEQAIEYRLFLWMTDVEEPIQVLALDPNDLRRVHSVDDDDLWRLN
jgi:hypothetical protein